MINRTTQTQQTELARRLPAAERSIRDLKNKQSIGADSLSIVESTPGSYSSTYAAGAVGGLRIDVYAEVKRRYLSEMKVTFYLNNDLNPSYAWPYGASILPNQLDVSQYLDLAVSDELGTGNKSYVFRIANTSGASITLYMHFSLIFPNQTLIP